MYGLNAFPMMESPSYMGQKTHVKQSYSSALSPAALLPQPQAGSGRRVPRAAAADASHTEPGAGSPGSAAVIGAEGSGVP